MSITRRNNNQQPIFPQSVQFPGSQHGANLQTVKSLVAKQKKVKGYRYTVPTGNSNQTLQLPGEAKLLLGFKGYGVNGAAPIADLNFSVLVNNEKILDTVATAQIDANQANSNQTEEYFPVNRPLAGQDTVNIEFQNNDAAAAVFYVHVFYI